MTVDKKPLLDVIVKMWNSKGFSWRSDAGKIMFTMDTVADYQNLVRNSPRFHPVKKVIISDEKLALFSGVPLEKIPEILEVLIEHRYLVKLDKPAEILNKHMTNGKLYRVIEFDPISRWCLKIEEEKEKKAKENEERLQRLRLNPPKKKNWPLPF